MSTAAVVLLCVSLVSFQPTMCIILFLHKTKTMNKNEDTVRNLIQNENDIPPKTSLASKIRQVNTVYI